MSFGTTTKLLLCGLEIMGSISGFGARANLTFQHPTKWELCALGCPLYHTIVY